MGVPNNYVTDEMFEEALQEGKECDEQRQRDNWEKKCWKPGRDRSKCYPPFFGVPSSIKESILYKGRRTYAGVVFQSNPIPTEDSQFVIVAKNMGLIFFVRSNVPPGCKAIETNNNIFGYCLNPWNKERSCGGSSGGEGGMLGAYCAPIGFGTDMAGSLRVPAEFNGIVTIKGSMNRISKKGNCSFGPYSDGLIVKGDIGPMAQSVEDLITVCNFFFDKKNYQNVPLHQLDPYNPYK